VDPCSSVVMATFHCDTPWKLRDIGPRINRNRPPLLLHCTTRPTRNNPTWALPCHTTTICVHLTRVFFLGFVVLVLGCSQHKSPTAQIPTSSFDLFTPAQPNPNFPRHCSQRGPCKKARHPLPWTPRRAEPTARQLRHDPPMHRLQHPPLPDSRTIWPRSIQYRQSA